ncbi:complement component 7b isoform X2 [Osmerus mordax]|uniref:complement component 7b isoform X2 n=1 Tax=Osmerus mordax TaxID=8014 RepID=UPI00350FD993
MPELWVTMFSKLWVVYELGLSERGQHTNTVSWQVNVALPWLLLFYVSHIRCQQPVNCQWGPYGEWSECDGCFSTQVRSRPVQAYAQYGGAPCSGEPIQRQACVPKKACPLADGCGERFRCGSDQCVSPSLLCNGDQDCEDGSDERRCDANETLEVCDLDQTPPSADITGRGYDLLSGELRAPVINTLSFGGQCRKVFSGDSQTIYRLPLNLIKYNFQVQVDHDFSEESYESSWTYMQHLQNDASWGHDRRTFHNELDKDKSYKLIILRNTVELAQFQNSAPQYLNLAEGFWKALASLPLTYDYPAYRSLLQTYGTHYLSEGALGGQYQVLLELDNEALKETRTTDREYQRCWRTVKRRLLRKKDKTTCEKLVEALKSSSAYSNNKLRVKTNVVGGATSFMPSLSVLDLDNPEANGDQYDRWARSVKDFPVLIKPKVLPLHALVKEVQCAGLRRAHLRRAEEEYLAEEHPCHCPPCANNGQSVLTGTRCSCACRLGTWGPACQAGTVVGEQPGVIHGRWSCWSSWGSCSGVQRSRSRTCTNPAPRGGGLHCVGSASDFKPCEDSDLQQLQMMEPHCFGLPVNSTKQCDAPPALRNGFVLNPRDNYLVGTTIEYSCIDGYYISGDRMATCTDSQSWDSPDMECKHAACEVPSLESDVIGVPMKATYEMGEKVFLSCPSGMTLEGEREVICSSSLQWSPSPWRVTCREVTTVAMTSISPKLGCKPWEIQIDGVCVCRMPNQCQPSMLLCATLPGGRRRTLGICQLGSLTCLGRSFTLANDSDCDWPNREFTSCQNCQSGETCDESATKCVCQDPAKCSKHSNHLCVRLGDGGVAVMMTECEAGARRCRAELITVVGIDACPP